MNNPKITIITPSFNQGNYLEQTIDSVLSQNYNNLEYIIIDGGSKDASIEIIKKYEKHFRYWISEPDLGQSHAINKGLHMASGEIVNWLNSDDYYEAHALKVVSDAFTDPTVNAVCARSNIVRNGVTLRSSRGSDIYSGNLGKTIGWARIDQPETFFRRSSYEKVGWLNEKLHYVMDKEWWIRYLFTFGLEGIVQTDKVIVNFRLHAQSKTESKKLEFEYENDLLYWSLANQAGLTDINFFLDEVISQRPVKPIQFSIPTLNLVKEAINYFLLLKADQQYYYLNFEMARKILEQIDPANLSSEDLKLMRNLSFKSRYLPSVLVKILRRWM